MGTLFTASMYHLVDGFPLPIQNIPVWLTQTIRLVFIVAIDFYELLLVFAILLWLASFSKLLADGCTILMNAHLYQANTEIIVTVKMVVMTSLKCILRNYVNG